MAAVARVAERGAGVRPSVSTAAPARLCPDRRRDPARRPRPALRPVRLAPPGSPAPRRGGALRVLAVVVATVAVVCGLGALGQRAGARDVPGAVAEVRVGAGETLWDVAERVAPGSDEQAVAARIRELNGLAGSAVRPGQEIRVPAEA